MQQTWSNTCKASIWPHSCNLFTGISLVWYAPQCHGWTPAVSWHQSSICLLSGRSNFKPSRSTTLMLEPFPLCNLSLFDQSPMSGCLQCFVLEIGIAKSFSINENLLHLLLIHEFLPGVSQNVNMLHTSPWRSVYLCILTPFYDIAPHKTNCLLVFVYADLFASYRQE